MPYVLAEAEPIDPKAKDVYERTLSFFDDQVVSIVEAEWHKDVLESVDVRQLVASAARAQYCPAYQLEGRSRAEAENQLPRDPLGIDAADGWQLAPERARLALNGLTGGGSLRVTHPQAARLLRRAAIQLLIRGWSVASAIDKPPSLDPQLAEVSAIAAPPAAKSKHGTDRPHRIVPRLRRDLTDAVSDPCRPLRGADTGTALYG